MVRGLQQSALLIAGICIVNILTDALALGQVNVEPNTALLNEGDRTELLCRYGHVINYCRIEIPGEKVLNLSPEWSKTPGFTYYGAGLEAGQCGVSIERVKAINNGQVKCSLGVQGEEFSATIDLVVALRPEQPIIELVTKPATRDGYFEENNLFQARCRVNNGRPAANITWYLDNMPADKSVSSLQVQDTTNAYNVSLFSTLQEIKWYLGPEDDGKKLICRSHHQTDRENLPPQEAAYSMLVRFAPVKQSEALVYGLYLEHTAIVNVTIRSNPPPIVEWTVNGVVIKQGQQEGRFSVYEPQYLGQDYYNVTMAIAGLTLEDTTKPYLLRASNALGSTDYQVRISSSSTPPTAGLDIGAIVGIVVAVAVLIVIILLIIFARATGRWCFGGKSVKTTTNETSDTESADLKATSTATTATTTAATSEALTGVGAGAGVGVGVEADAETNTKKSKRLPSFAAIFKRFNERDATKRSKTYESHGDDAAESDQLPEGTDGNDNEPKENKQLVYAELVLKPAEQNETTPPPQPPTTKPANQTEYAEIVYVQKPSGEQTKK